LHELATILLDKPLAQGAPFFVQKLL
jgi:hypothetical protein